VQLGVRGGVLRDLEEGLEDVLDDILEVVDQAAGFEHLVQARHLNEPADVVRDELVVHDPLGELVPLVGLAAVDGHTPLRVLVLGLLEVGDELGRELGEVLALEEVVGLEEDLPQTRRPGGVVAVVEAVEAVELLVRVHVERVDAQVIRGEVERVKHLAQRQVLAVAVDDNLVGTAAQLALDKAQQVLLVHARAVVDMRVDLAHVVKVTVRDRLHVRELLVLIEQAV
jgi:hypothetical protein